MGAGPCSCDCSLIGLRLGVVFFRGCVTLVAHALSPDVMHVHVCRGATHDACKVQCPLFAQPCEHTDHRRREAQQTALNSHVSLLCHPPAWPNLYQRPFGPEYAVSAQGLHTLTSHHVTLTSQVLSPCVENAHSAQSLNFCDNKEHLHLLSVSSFTRAGSQWVRHANASVASDVFCDAMHDATSVTPS